jgi:hypothetical protein
MRRSIHADRARYWPAAGSIELAADLSRFPLIQPSLGASA